jgi:hypothetical protein
MPQERQTRYSSGIYLALFCDLLTHQDEGNSFLQNTARHSPNNTASYTTRPELSESDERNSNLENF